jgi:hypothetical protein
MSGTWANNDKVREALGIRKVSLGCRHVAQSLVLNTPFMLESSNSSQRLCYHALELINNLPLAFSFQIKEIVAASGSRDALIASPFAF